jgi:putative intracellular protease/amidase
MVAVLVPIADDSEEIETACITDVLVRAGIEVRHAGVSRRLLTGLAARQLWLMNASPLCA